MGEFVHVWGEIQLSQANANRWRASRVDASRWKDASDPLGGADDNELVAELLAGWTDWNPTLGDDNDIRVEFLTIAATDGGLRVRGRIDEETFREMGPMLVALFRSTADFDAKGSVAFDAFRKRLVIESGKSTFARLATRAADSAARKEIDDTLGTLPVPAAILIGGGEAAVRARIVAAATAVPEAEIFAVRSEFNHGLRLAPEVRDWPTGFLLQCLGETAPSHVEALAQDFLACSADVEQRKRAYGALGAVASESAVDTLVEAILLPVRKNDPYKTEHLGVQWGLRRTKVHGAAKKLDAAIERWKALPKPNAQIGKWLQELRALKQ